MCLTRTVLSTRKLIKIMFQGKPTQRNNSKEPDRLFLLKRKSEGISFSQFFNNFQFPKAFSFQEQRKELKKYLFPSLLLLLLISKSSISINTKKSILSCMNDIHTVKSCSGFFLQSIVDNTFFHLRQQSHVNPRMSEQTSY